jgi:hypothetical protein
VFSNFEPFSLFKQFTDVLKNQYRHLTATMPFVAQQERNMKHTKIIVLTGLILSVFMAQASAESIRLGCESRGTSRSKISVDGRGFAKNKLFRAKVKSGGVTLLSKSWQRANVNNEVEFDFDSDRADILAGATSIPKTFIKNSAVSAFITDAQGFEVTTSATCKSKK